MGWRSALQSHGWSCSFLQQLSLLCVWWLMTVFVFYSSNTVVVTSTMIPSALTTPGITSEYNSTTYFASVGQVYINKTEHNRTNPCASRNMVHSHKSKTVTGIHLGAILESSIQCKLQNATSTPSHPFSVNATNKWICVIYQGTVSDSYTQCLTLMYSVQIGVSVISQSLVPTLQWQTCHIHRLWLKQQHQWIWNRMDNTMTHTNQHCQFQYYQLHVVWLQQSISPSRPSNFTSPSTFRKKVHAWMLSDDEEEPGAEYEWVHATYMKERYFPHLDETRLVEVSEPVRRKKKPSTSLATPSLTSLSSSAPVTSSTTSLAAPSLTTSTSSSTSVTSFIPSASLATPSLTTLSSTSLTSSIPSASLPHYDFQLVNMDDPEFHVSKDREMLQDEINKAMKRDLEPFIKNQMKILANDRSRSKLPKDINSHNNYAAIRLSRKNPSTGEMESLYRAAASDPDQRRMPKPYEKSFAHSEPIAFVDVLNAALDDGWFHKWQKPGGFVKFTLDDVYDHNVYSKRKSYGLISSALSSLKEQQIQIAILSERGLCLQHRQPSCSKIFSKSGILKGIPSVVFSKVRYSAPDRNAFVERQMVLQRTSRVNDLRGLDLTQEEQMLLRAYNELGGPDNNFRLWFYEWYEQEKSKDKDFDPDTNFLKSSFTKWVAEARGKSPKINYSAPFVAQLLKDDDVPKDSSSDKVSTTSNKAIKKRSPTTPTSQNDDQRMPTGYAYATSTSTLTSASGSASISTTPSTDSEKQYELDMAKAKKLSLAHQHDPYVDPLLSSSSDTLLSSSSFRVHASTSTLASITSTSTSTSISTSTTPTSTHTSPVHRDRSSSPSKARPDVNRARHRSTSPKSISRKRSRK